MFGRVGKGGGSGAGVNHQCHNYQIRRVWLHFGETIVAGFWKLCVNVTVHHTTFAEVPQVTAQFVQRLAPEKWFPAHEALCHVVSFP